MANSMCWLPRLQVRLTLMLAETLFPQYGFFRILCNLAMSRIRCAHYCDASSSTDGQPKYLMNQFQICNTRLYAQTMFNTSRFGLPKTIAVRPYFQIPRHIYD